MAESLGDVLKQARIEKGLSLDEVQEMTKIRKRYLQAIEADRYNELPGSFYVRAFIKSYAEAVDLNPNAILQMYRSVLPDKTPEPVIEPIRRRRKYSNTDKLTKWASFFLLICFVLLISSIIYYFLINSDQPEDANYLDETPLTERTEDELSQVNDPHNEQGSNTNDADPTLPGNDADSVPDDEKNSETDPEMEPENEPEPEPVVKLVSTDQVTYIYNVSNTDMLQIDMEIVGDECWVQVKRDNNNGEDFVPAAMYYKEQTEQFEVPHSLWIRLGRPNAASIIINGQSIDDILNTSNPRNIQINLVQTGDL